MAIEKENEIRNKCEIEKNRIANYCNDIKKKFENVDRTIRNYEETVQHLKEENEKIADEYDIKIDELEQKNNKIVKRIDNRIDLFNHQKAQIIEGENKVNNILQSIEIQKNEFKEKAMINKIKYDELEKKFANLQKKIYEKQMSYEVKKAENIQNYKKIDVVSQEKTLYEKELQKIEDENIKLSQEINNMKQLWRSLTSIDMDSSSNNRKKKKRIGSGLNSITEKRKKNMKRYLK